MDDDKITITQKEYRMLLEANAQLEMIHRLYNAEHDRYIDMRNAGVLLGWKREENND